MSFLEHLLLQLFYAGLDKESTHHLDLTSGDSLAQLTPIDGREILDKILDRTFVCMHEPPLAEHEVRQEEVPAIESEPIEANP